ncbi:MAG: DUF2786 domain-containing protein [Desulfomonilaceae bacterium]|nr:DUF2786 domain-containing protein [Desulfomonilaceae bacterium]
MTKQEVVSKVRKLFELAKSSNENEAALAAAKARELLSRHNMAYADVPPEEIRNSLDVCEAFVDAGSVLRNWIKGLIIHVSHAFECQAMVRRRRGLRPLLSFIGTKTDAEVAASTFRFLAEELTDLSDKALPSLKRQHRGWNTAALRYAYLGGAVVRIGERLQESTDRIKAEEENVCKDLVLAKERMIHDYMRRTFGTVRREYGRTRAVSARAFQQGYMDAEKIDIGSDGDRERIGNEALTA